LRGPAQGQGPLLGRARSVGVNSKSEIRNSKRSRVSSFRVSYFVLPAKRVLLVRLVLLPDAEAALQLGQVERLAGQVLPRLLLALVERVHDLADVLLLDLGDLLLRLGVEAEAALAALAGLLDDGLAVLLVVAGEPLDRGLLAVGQLEGIDRLGVGEGGDVERL